MADLAVECKRRPRLRLLLTMRPETARRLDIPDEFAVQYVHEDADIALPELFRRYCKHYKVNTYEVPWLDWASRPSTSILCGPSHSKRREPYGDIAPPRYLF